MRASASPARWCAACCREQTEGRQRLRLALQRERLERFRFDGAANKRERGFPDQHLTWLRRLLQAGRDVDRVAGHEALFGPGDDLTGGEADAALQAKLGKSLAHLDRRAAGAEGVVLVGERHAEDGQPRR